MKPEGSCPPGFLSGGLLRLHFMSTDGYGLLFLELILLLILICGSAFFSSCEMALFSLSRAKVAAYKNDPSPTKRRIYFLLDNYNRTLVSIILSNMFVNSCISMLNDTLLRDAGLSGGTATAVSAVTGIVVLLLFGEITPMTLAYIYCEPWSKVAAYPVCIMRVILFPVIYIAEKLSDLILDFLGRRDSEPLTYEEYESYIEKCAQHGAFSEEETAFLKETLAFSERNVMEVMQDRISIGFVPETASAREVEKLICRFRKVYLPVGKKTLDDADRILSAKAFFRLPPVRRSDWLHSDCVSEAFFIPEQSSVISTMRDLRKKNAPAALICDEYGGVSGLISLSGIYAALTGGLVEGEKSHPLEPIEQDDEHHKWRYDGLTSFDSVLQDTGWTPDREFESSTLNGVFCELYGSLPSKDAVAEASGLRIRVLDVSGNRASKLEVELLTGEEIGKC